MVARTAREQGKARLQSRQQGLGRQEVAAGGGQLNRQRKPVQPPAHFCHGTRVRRGEGEGRRHSLGSCREEANGGGGGRLVGRRRRRIRQHQRRHRELVFAGDVQNRAAGHQHRQPGTGHHQPRHRRRRRRDLLEFVQQDEHVPPRQRGGEALGQRPVAGFPHPQCLGDCRQHQRRVGQWGKVHEPDAVPELVAEVRCHLHRQARLADAAGASEGDEGYVLPKQQGTHGGEFPFPPDQGRARAGERRRDHGVPVGEREQAGRITIRRRRRRGSVPAARPVMGQVCRGNLVDAPALGGAQLAPGDGATDRALADAQDGRGGTRRDPARARILSAVRCPCCGLGVHRAYSIAHSQSQHKRKDLPSCQGCRSLTNAR
ncbi:MAG: hypothetical protein M3Q71_16120 [Chloroflexota bacterium]|nr:hypothetical protein [Chloroflexota bacterium]